MKKSNSYIISGVRLLNEQLFKKNSFPKKKIGKIVLLKRRKPNQSLINKNISKDEIYDFIRMLDAPGYLKAYLNFKYLEIHF